MNKHCISLGLLKFYRIWRPAPNVPLSHPYELIWKFKDSHVRISVCTNLCSRRFKSNQSSVARSQIARLQPGGIEPLSSRSPVVLPCSSATLSTSQRGFHPNQHHCHCPYQILSLELLTSLLDLLRLELFAPLPLLLPLLSIIGSSFTKDRSKHKTICGFRPCTAPASRLRRENTCQGRHPLTDRPTNAGEACPSASSARSSLDLT